VRLLLWGKGKGKFGSVFAPSANTQLYGRIRFLRDHIPSALKTLDAAQLIHGEVRREPLA
jgi:hypothetical protein